MEASQQVVVVPRSSEPSVVPKRLRRSVAEKRRIVEETLVEGASVARVARAHGVNANQVFYWRTLYQAGRLVASSGARLLPIRVRRESLPPSIRLKSVTRSVCTTSIPAHLLRFVPLDGHDRLPPRWILSLHLVQKIPVTSEILSSRRV